MDRITLALVIAQNGLRAAATLLAAKAAKAEKAGTGTGPEAAKAKKDAAKAKKLAAALSAADAGITSYISDTES